MYAAIFSTNTSFQKENWFCMGHAIDNFNWTGCHIHPKQTEKTNNQASTTRKGKLDLDNRLGHSISYDEVNNVETYFADVQAKRKCICSFVPNIVRPSTFVTFVYDNCDHNSKTLSGIFLHCTNGIMTQKPTLDGIVQGCLQQQSTDTFRKRKRYFKWIDEDETNHIPIQKKITPMTMASVEVFGNTMYEAIPRKEDLIWVMSRFQSVEISKDQKAGQAFINKLVHQNTRMTFPKLFTSQVLENHQQRVLACKKCYNKLKSKQNLLVYRKEICFSIMRFANWP